MKKRYFLLYFFVLTIPIFLGFAAWQSNQYKELEKTVRDLEVTQEELIEKNNMLIADIAILSSSSTIEHRAVHELGLLKILPEDILQVRIEGGEGY